MSKWGWNKPPITVRSKNNPNLERARTIKLLLKEGLTVTAIAEELGMARPTISEYIANYNLRAKGSLGDIE